MSNSSKPNQLINESSPYLLQHAHNPVNWFSWSPDVFAQAKNENKLVLISIGYSACHWCHVMEHECFEDEEVADLMNKHFMCIKLDREEHPHIDSLYMTAVQLMNKQGGWPLNCFVLPDGRPIYGGTYFNKSAWMDVLESLQDVYKNNKSKVLDYARKITNEIRQDDLILSPIKDELFYSGILEEYIESWTQTFDPKNGGPTRAPKFPLPNNYDFLLTYCFLKGDRLVHDHVYLTLNKMAQGGIYDQLGGGFARYSVDEKWKVPHFEKMLYDNAQLISLYCDAYKESANYDFKIVAEECLAFVANELTDKNGCFYSALDADSEGKEGVFYTWTENTLRNVLTPDEFTIIQGYYNINPLGYWEHDQYILLRDKSLKQFTEERSEFSIGHASELLKSAKNKLSRERDKRIKPGLDDKILLSWNALMIKAYADAALSFNNQDYLETAFKAAEFIQAEFHKPDGSLWHTHKNGVSKINGLLEDYAFLIAAYIRLYQATFDEKWLTAANELCNYTCSNFSDEENTLFYFNHQEDDQLIARKKEVSDNVIPSANSVMALNLFYLGNYFYQDSWLTRANKMLQLVWEPAKSYLPGYSNWAKLMLFTTEPFQEVSLTGPLALDWARLLNADYLPNVIVAASVEPSALTMLTDKFKSNETLAFVCHNKFCERPFNTFNELEYHIAHKK